MRTRDLLTVTFAGLGAIGGGMLIYGALVESNRLVRESFKIQLSAWPARLDGFKIAVLSDFHLRDQYSLDLAKRAIDLALEEEPDFIVLAGDIVGYWKPESPRLIGEAFNALLAVEGKVVAIPGNHEYWGAGNPELLRIILDQLSIKLLRNESWSAQGVCWVGLDSYNEGEVDFEAAFGNADAEPRIALWHEPDLVDALPDGCVLQISGHSHGGQFRFPFGLTPKKTRNGEKYRDGFYPDAKTPLFVSRGIGTTGPPSRFLCPPQVAFLTISSA